MVLYFAIANNYDFIVFHFTLQYVDDSDEGEDDDKDRLFIPNLKHVEESEWERDSEGAVLILLISELVMKY